MLRQVLFFGLIVACVILCDQIVKQHIASIWEHAVEAHDQSYPGMAVDAEQLAGKCHALELTIAKLTGGVFVLLLGFAAFGYGRPESERIQRSKLRWLANGVLHTGALQLVWFFSLLVLALISGFAGFTEAIAHGYEGQGGMHFPFLETVADVACELVTIGFVAASLWIGPPSGWDGEDEPEWF